MRTPQLAVNGAGNLMASDGDGVAAPRHEPGLRPGVGAVTVRDECPRKGPGKPPRPLEGNRDCLRYRVAR